MDETDDIELILSKMSEKVKDECHEQISRVLSSWLKKIVALPGLVRGRTNRGAETELRHGLDWVKNGDIPLTEVGN